MFVIGVGRLVKALKLGYFQGPTVNLPEGNQQINSASQDKFGKRILWEKHSYSGDWKWHQAINTIEARALCISTFNVSHLGTLQIKSELVPCLSSPRDTHRMPVSKITASTGKIRATSRTTFPFSSGGLSCYHHMPKLIWDLKRIVIPSDPQLKW